MRLEFTTSDSASLPIGAGADGAVKGHVNRMLLSSAVHPSFRQAPDQAVVTRPAGQHD
jgi:hypothetical protein